ncbi:MAG: hypothetical protein IJO39_04825 [Clostridia bacterium]|nr:hypothetical protein [Clostridia bacterium]
MQLKPVVKEGLRLYKKNFAPLMLCLLVQGVLRFIALTPLLFLADKALAPLALLALPLYLLIALPARQNVALALQDMISGGSVFSLRLLSTADYGRKLLHGLKGTLCMLLWSALTLSGVTLLFLSFKGLTDGFTLMGVFYVIGGSVADGVWIVLGALCASTLLILLGCALHSGSRHAASLGNKALLRGNRLRLMGLWFLGLMLVVPFLAVVGVVLGDFALSLPAALRNMQLPSLTLTASQWGMLIVSAAVLLLPLLPLKNLLPAVYLHMAKEARDAQA